MFDCTQGKKFIFLYIKWMLTSNPIKKFSLEIQLMKWGATNSRWIRKKFQRRLFYVYGCDVSHSACIAENTLFPHPIGIVIGSNVKIKPDCIIYQQVTIGGNFDTDNSMATIESGVRIGAGAKIIGKLTVCENSVIGANSTITKSVPANSVVVGINQILRRTIL
ncbi:TPA: serine acetyltransferase [Vibrio vulnificus]